MHFIILVTERINDNGTCLSPRVCLKKLERDPWSFDYHLAGPWLNVRCYYCLYILGNILLGESVPLFPLRGGIQLCGQFHGCLLDNRFVILILYSIWFITVTSDVYKNVYSWKPFGAWNTMKLNVKRLRFTSFHVFCNFQTFPFFFFVGMT